MAREFQVGDMVRFRPEMLTQTATFYVANLQPGKFKLMGKTGNVIAANEGVFSIHLESGEIVLGIRPQFLESV